MKEASKSKVLFGDIERQAIQGRGIDIGCGNDPISSEAMPFDIQHGDANFISKYVRGPFDYVYASHCLEHMHDPQAALLEWWSLVRPGGYLFFAVPDEDLYEQG